MIISLLALCLAFAARWRRVSDELRESKRQRELDASFIAATAMELLRRDGQVRNLRKVVQNLMGTTRNERRE